jgi:hypothetical protein
MDLLEIGSSVMDWIDRYKWRALVNSGNEPLGSIKMLGTIEWLYNLWPLEWYSAPQS